MRYFLSKHGWWDLKALIKEMRKIFNYRLSRVRRIVENTFGILVVFWIFQELIELRKLVLAAIALHNYIRQTGNASYSPSGFIDCENGDGEIISGQWGNNVDGNTFQNIPKIRSSKYTINAIKTREELAYDLFRTVSFPWQMNYIRQTGQQ